MDLLKMEAPNEALEGYSPFLVEQALKAAIPAYLHIGRTEEDQLRAEVERVRPDLELHPTARVITGSGERNPQLILFSRFRHLQPGEEVSLR